MTKIFKKCSKFIACLASLLLSINIVAQRATDQEMSRQALASATGKSDREHGIQVKQQSFAVLSDREGVQTLANGQVSATIVFTSGKSIKEISNLGDSYELEIIRVEVKSAAGDAGKVLTISIGANELLIHQGSIEERISIAIGARQLSLANMLTQPGTNLDPNLVDAAFNPTLKIYAIEVVSKSHNLLNAANRNDIATLLLDESSSTVESYNLLSERLASSHVSNGVRGTFILNSGDDIRDKLPKELRDMRIMTQQGVSLEQIEELVKQLPKREER